MNAINTSKHIYIPVLVAALGYFVDIYDLQLFNLIGKKSLGIHGLNLPKIFIEKYDYQLFLWQMGGMLLGGIVFGILGDKFGRKSVLFSSILIYSLANIANGFVTTPEQYALIRFIAGFGLSGELGAAITLVSEIISKEKRGWATMIIVTTGALGAVVANLIAKNTTWQNSYFIGGALGLLLLSLRIGTFESTFFNHMKAQQVSKGNFFQLFKQKNILKYLSCIIVGLPVWYVIGILIKFAAKFHSYPTLIDDKILTGNAIMYSYIGLSIGDLFSGILSQYFKSRKKIVLAYLLFTVLICTLYIFNQQMPIHTFYLMCFLLGFATGYWALFVTMSSEQFGTNIRATVTTTTPNFVRGAVIPIVLGFKQFEVTQGAIIIGFICISLAIIATLYLSETFGKDLNYYEIS